MEYKSKMTVKNAPSDPAVRIWLVDDDACFCENMLLLLEDAKPRVDCSRSFSSALSMLTALRQESPPDVILMDVQMPDMNGVEAIRPVKHLSPSTKVLMLTTCYDVDLKGKALAAGAADFLLKRYPPARIIAAICTPNSNASPQRQIIRYDPS